MGGMKDKFGDTPFQSELPFQSHSLTSWTGQQDVRKERRIIQDRWVYETHQQHLDGLADFQLWSLAEPTGFFDQLSSMRRARVQLVWRNRKAHNIDGSPYHPIEKTACEAFNQDTNRMCEVWRIKPFYRGMPYAQWVQNYWKLARP